MEEKITAFEQKSNNRFELAIAFLKDANQAEKYAQQENPERIRDFLKKIGSNFRIADRTLVLDFKNAFKIAEKVAVQLPEAFVSFRLCRNRHSEPEGRRISFVLPTSDEILHFVQNDVNSNYDTV